ncbi:MAG TPA: glycosyl hydrolase [Gemmatimonadales bacterium]|nr:glycosyl hydrolase [Gemmatimonadales bacterium]
MPSSTLALPLAIALLLASVEVEAGAQAPRQAPAGRPAVTAPAGDSALLTSLVWRNLGPLRGGRSVAAAGSAARPNEYYMGTTGGGVFKTTDGGQTWQPVSDRFFGGTIGAIAVSESNPDVVYVGGGEFPIRGNVSHGDGVYKSTDAGRTWTYVGLVETRQIAKIRIHPRNPDIVYVAALGPVFGPSPHRGVFKSTDGGRSWDRILFRNDTTGAIDLSMDPRNPDVLYAGLWHAYRKPWQLVSGGAGSGLFKSIDGGRTWKEITRNPGLPRGTIGNTGISVSGANSSRVYALIEADSGGVYRSDDGGDTWTRVNADRSLRQRAWYYTRIYADPQDENTVYASNVQFQRSRDGGRTWQSIRAPHGDSHDLWIAPNNNQRMIESNDGGSNVSTDAGRTWTDQDYATAQFYHVTTTNHFPYRVCGAQQDNSTACMPSRGVGGSDLADYYDAGGGESGYIAVRPDNPDIIFAGSYGGFLTRKDSRTGIERNVNPWPLNPMGHDAKDAKYRMQWTFPIVISPHDPNTLYVGSSVVFRSTDEGSSFTPISGDLTRNDPRTLGPSGGPITKDQTSVEYYATVFTISESPLEKGVIWTGSDDGLVHVTRDGGATWSNVTPPGIPEWMRMSIIEASHHARGTAYLAGNRFQLADHAPYLFRTTDYGKTWTRITTGIPAGEFTRVIREDPVRQGLLYAGTERGVWVTFDDGASWRSLQRNLPPVPVHDLAVKEGDLVAGTHGRAFWILDDLSVLRQHAANLADKEAHLFTPRGAYRIVGGGFGFGGGFGGAPARPPATLPPLTGWDGAVVHYWLKRGGQPVRIEFLDARGQVIRSFTSEPDSATRADSLRMAAQRAARDSLTRRRADSLAALGVMAAAVRPDSAEGPPPAAGWRYIPPPRAPNRAGMNRFTWNLRTPDAVGFPGMIFWAGGLTGPVVPPGTYTVRLVAGGETQTQTFEVLRDPRQNASPADLAEQYDFLVRIRDRTNEANRAVIRIRELKAQLADRRARAGSSGAALERAGNALTAQLSAVEEEIYQVRNRSGQDPLNYPIKLNNQVAALSGVVASAEAKPTRQSYEVFELLSGQLAGQLAKLDAVLGAPLAAVNAELRRLGLPPLASGAAPGVAGDRGR